MAEENPFLDESISKRPPLVDYHRVLSLSLRWWYYILGSLLIALSITFFKNRYTQRIYPVSMSILIKESDEAGNTADLLYNNPLINSYRNFYNELYILKSYPLIQSVIEDLNFNVTVFKEGRFKTTEIYQGLPFSIIAGSKINGIYRFKIVNDSTYEWSLLNSEHEKIGETKVLEFAKESDFLGKNISISTISAVNIKNVIGEEYIIKITSPVSLARSYSSRLKAAWAEKGASVVNMAMSGPIPKKNIDFLNKLTENYKALDLTRKRQTADNSLVFIDQQLNAIKDSLSIFETEMESFKKDNVITDLGAEAVRVLAKLDILNEEKAKILIQEKYFDYLEEIIRNDNNHDNIILPSIAGISDPILVNLINQLTEIQVEYKLIGDLGNNPMVSNRKKAVKGLILSIQESMLSLEHTQQIAKEQLNKEILKYEFNLRKLPTAERALVSIQRNYRLNESLFTFLMQKRAEAGISKASASSDIEIINSAYQSGGSSQPQVRKNYLMAMFGGIGFPLAIIILIIALNNKVQSKTDIETLTKIPILGAIGHNDSNVNIVVAKKPKSAISESFRALRSNLNYFTPSNGNGGGKIYVVTSSISGEGKTFTTMNLATVFAYSGKKTLIIGGDLRKPRMYGDFGLKNDIGMSSILSDLNAWEDCVQPTFIENLSFIAAGPVPPNPSELLMKSSTKDLLEKMKEAYDFILIDSPPIALVTDALILSDLADHTIYITRQNHTPKEALANINEYYITHKIKQISLVFNDVANNRFGYGYGSGYGYGYGYGYGAGYYDEEEPKKHKKSKS